MRSLIVRLWDHPVAGPILVRFARFTGGSFVALTTSEVVLVLCYATGLVGTSAATVLAFFAGAVPNYVLNRQWVWRRRGRMRVGREVVLYAAVSVVSLIASVAATGWAVHTVGGSASTRAAAAPAAYLLTYGVLFVVKFTVLETFVFTDRRAGGA